MAFNYINIVDRGSQLLDEYIERIKGDFSTAGHEIPNGSRLPGWTFPRLHR